MKDGYQQWLDYCLDKYNEEYKDNRKHYDADIEPFGVEFSEHGGIYLHGIGGTLHLKHDGEYSLLYFEAQIYDWSKR